LKTKPISNVTGYYGHFTINKVILKNDSTYLINSKYENEIISDSKLYAKLLASYNLTNILTSLYIGSKNKTLLELKNYLSFFFLRVFYLLLFLPISIILEVA
jgi:hypothetical protein